MNAGTLLAAVSPGRSLGAFFFGGLWWTVRKGVASESPALWFLASLVLRTAVTLAGFYSSADGDWQRCCCASPDSSLARLAVMVADRLARPRPAGGHHAP